MVFKAVLFDLDGVLVDTEQYILRSYNFALKQQGFPPMSEKRVAEVAGIPLREVYPRIAPIGNVEKFIKDHREWQAKHPEWIKKYAKAGEVLAKIRQKGIKVAIVTARYRASTEFVLQKTGLGKLADAIIAGDDLAEDKLTGKPFGEAMKKLAEKAENCLVVGDGCADIVGGKKAGCRTCRAVYGYGAKEECLEQADFEIKKLEEVLVKL